MSLSRREKVLLGVLLVTVAVVGARLLLRGGSGLGLAGPGRRPELAEQAGPEVARLRLEDLEPRSAQLEIGRDLFRFAPAPAPPRVEPPPRPTPRPAPPPAPKGPRPPRLDLSYLGSFGPEGRTIAVLSDGETIINAMEGDVLEGKFIIDSIGFESVDMKFVGFPNVPAKRLAAGR